LLGFGTESRWDYRVARCGVVSGAMRPQQP